MIVAQVTFPHKSCFEQHGVLEGLALVGLWQDMVQEYFGINLLDAVLLAPLVEGRIGGGKEGAGLALVVEVWDEASGLQVADEDGEARVGVEKVGDFR